MVNIANTQVVQPQGAFKGSALLLIDIQERLTLAIAETPRVILLIKTLVEKARQADMPILATEQYSRGLGPTVAGLRRLLTPQEVVEKIHFAAPREPAFRSALHERGILRCVVAGMEAHVCVLQSVLALLAQGVAVTVVGDAVASRADLNCRVALARMARAGAEIADSAAVLAGLDPSGGRHG
jgi:nicotinamidase-related amidase